MAKHIGTPLRICLGAYAGFALRSFWLPFCGALVQLIAANFPWALPLEELPKLSPLPHFPPNDKQWPQNESHVVIISPWIASSWETKVNDSIIRPKNTSFCERTLRFTLSTLTAKPRQYNATHSFSNWFRTKLQTQDAIMGVASLVMSTDFVRNQPWSLLQTTRKWADACGKHTPQHLKDVWKGWRMLKVHHWLTKWSTVGVDVLPTISYLPKLSAAGWKSNNSFSLLLCPNEQHSHHTADNVLQQKNRAGSKYITGNCSTVLMKPFSMVFWLAVGEKQLGDERKAKSARIQTTKSTLNRYPSHANFSLMLPISSYAVFWSGF